ncbi:MAG: hypothetical protein N2C14_20685 [Planctomycetales bacterium]
MNCDWNRLQAAASELAALENKLAGNHLSANEAEDAKVQIEQLNWELAGLLQTVALIGKNLIAQAG